jgi:MbtH protein
VQFRVVVNQEEQHSVWATGQDLPAGWRAEGFSGTRAECLAHIEEVWPDITPLSARAAAGSGHA